MRNLQQSYHQQPQHQQQQQQQQQQNMQMMGIFQQAQLPQLQQQQQQQPQSFQQGFNNHQQQYGHQEYQQHQQHQEYQQYQEKAKSKRRTRSKFSKEEDRRLRELVQQHGPIDWQFISSRMTDKTARQCRERYSNYLKPNLNHNEWTDEEEMLLISKVKKHGPKWSMLTQFFPNRSDVSLKNRFAKLENRHLKQMREQYYLRKRFPNIQLPQIYSPYHQNESNISNVPTNINQNSINLNQHQQYTQHTQHPQMIQHQQYHQQEQDHDQDQQQNIENFSFDHSRTNCERQLQSQPQQHVVQFQNQKQKQSKRQNQQKPIDYVNNIFENGDGDDNDNDNDGVGQIHDIFDSFLEGNDSFFLDDSLIMQ